MDPSPLDELTHKLGDLVQRQQQFQNEITELQRQIYNLRKKEIAEVKEVLTEMKPIEVAVQPAVPQVATAPLPESAPTPVIPTPKPKKVRTPIEEFIGTNLLNKIGIAVLVIGVGIGVQYAIDHDLINPLTRIVLGYLCGVILIGLAIRLKAKYHGFSAVLLSGGMAVLYFITFAAYDLYELFPQAVAFILMVLFTAFTVYAALQYNLRVIAIIGLVGAYAVPFLLSDGSGRVVILFSYVTIINIGILVLAFKKEWKQLYYLAFALTWLIFSAWFMEAYDSTIHLWTSLIFSSIFFVTFYITLLAYKLIREEALNRWDVVLLLLNSVCYYGYGYSAINMHEEGIAFLGLFTVFNAILHFVACYIVYTRRSQSKDVFYFVAGLVLVFLTLAVPVQLEGNWVTVIWAAEATVLFWIGRTKGQAVYEVLSYPLIILACGSLLEDWDNFYGHYVKDVPESFVQPFLNVQLLVSLIVCASLGYICRLLVDQRYTTKVKPGSDFHSALKIVIPAILLVVLYFTFFLEVQNYWEQRITASGIVVQEGEDSSFHSDYDLLQFQNIWILNYSALFTLAIAIINLKWVKNKILNYVVVGFGSLLLFTFVTSGIINLTVLRQSYLFPSDEKLYFRGIGHILIRYISLVIVGPLLWVNYKLTRSELFTEPFRKAERLFFHFVILAILGSELLGILALMRVENSEKLALSIFWGAYALGLIVYGLMKDLKYIRIAAIVLFGITLLKLFFYDLTNMGTIAKTMVMIILGVLLLVASFLYNKFKKPTHAQN